MGRRWRLLVVFNLICLFGYFLGGITISIIFKEHFEVKKNQSAEDPCKKLCLYFDKIVKMQKKKKNLKS